MIRPQMPKFLLLLLILASPLWGDVGPLEIHELPDREVEEDETLELKLETSGGSGDVRFSLVTGPQGMRVASDGELRWSPSESQGPSTNSIVVRASTLTSPTATNRSRRQRISQADIRGIRRHRAFPL